MGSKEYLLFRVCSSAVSTVLLARFTYRLEPPKLSYLTLIFLLAGVAMVLKSLTLTALEDSLTFADEYNFEVESTGSRVWFLVAPLICKLGFRKRPLGVCYPT